MRKLWILVLIAAVAFFVGALVYLAQPYSVEGAVSGRCIVPDRELTWPPSSNVRGWRDNYDDAKECQLWRWWGSISASRAREHLQCALIRNERFEKMCYNVWAPQLREDRGNAWSKPTPVPTPEPNWVEMALMDERSITNLEDSVARMLTSQGYDASNIDTILEGDLGAYSPGELPDWDCIVVQLGIGGPRRDGDLGAHSPFGIVEVSIAFPICGSQEALTRFLRGMYMGRGESDNPNATWGEVGVQWQAWGYPDAVRLFARLRWGVN